MGNAQSIPECHDEIVKAAKDKAKTCVEAVDVKGQVKLSNGKLASFWTEVDQERKPHLRWSIK